MRRGEVWIRASNAEEEVKDVLDQVDAVINKIVDANKDDRVCDIEDWASACTTNDVLNWVLGVGMQTPNFMSELKLEELKSATFGERSG